MSSPAIRLAWNLLDPERISARPSGKLADLDEPGGKIGDVVPTDHRSERKVSPVRADSDANAGALRSGAPPPRWGVDLFSRV
jgi:hypothetical protein